MKTRPWPLVLLALFQILSPVGTVLFNAWALDVKPGYILSWLLQRPAGQVFESLLLMPLAGLALYQMKSWSYAFFLGALSWGFYRNLTHWDYAARHFSLGWAVLMYALQAGLALYFLIPSVRRTYLDPRVRWWEAKRRFLLRGEIDVQGKDLALKGRMENLSEGGVFVELAARLEPGTKAWIRLAVLSIVYELKATVIYSIPKESGVFAHGLRFEHTPESRKRLRHLVRGLELIGIPYRDQDAASPWYLSLVKWASRVVRTGRGLLPEA